MNQSFVKKYGTLLLLAAGAGIIFQLPYIRETFYPQIQAAMNLSNAQMGLLSSGYATVEMCIRDSISTVPGQSLRMYISKILAYSSD